MFRPALRSSSRVLVHAGRTASASAGRRFTSTTPAQRKGTWRGTVVRWGLAAAIVYWYATSQMFADELEDHSVPVPAAFSEADKPTIDRIVEEKRKLAEERAQARAKEAEEAKRKAAAVEATAAQQPPRDDAGEKVAADHEATTHADTPEGAAALEEEAEQQGAFNPETGEINWDCPCLGGMAHGPCGEEFKAAFSCFVYSTEEPKGMDCIDKFQNMQDCFRKYPEVYGAELTDEDNLAEGEATPATGESEEAPGAKTEAPVAKAGGLKDEEAAPATTKTTAATKTTANKSGVTEPKPTDREIEAPAKKKETAPDSSKADASEPVALTNKGKGTVIPEGASP